jgi:hypothetical protein
MAAIFHRAPPIRLARYAAMALQQIGRGMRPGPGKTLVVLDHALPSTLRLSQS